MNSSAFRTYTIPVIFICAALLVTVRLFFVQIVHGEKYADQADRQYITPLGSLFERGTIYLTGKDGELVSGATQKIGYKVAINNIEIAKNNAGEKLFYELQEILPTQETIIKNALTKTADPYEEIANKLDLDTIQKLEKKDFPGVHIYKEK